MYLPVKEQRTAPASATNAGPTAYVYPADVCAAEQQQDVPESLPRHSAHFCAGHHSAPVPMQLAAVAALVAGWPFSAPRTPMPVSAWKEKLDEYPRVLLL